MRKTEKKKKESEGAHLKRNFQVRPFGCNFLKKETRKSVSEKVCALQSKKFRGNIKMNFCAYL